MGEKCIYLVPYAHLDSQWRWTFVTTIRHYLRNTLAKNFPLFEKYPHYCFNFTGALRYGMMKDYYPAEYERLKDYVRRGRWKPAGSCLEETDALIPSPESLIRNILYGNRFFAREFGVRTSDYMLPDCFGFPASLPSVLAHCGIKGFSTQKLSWQSAAGIPFSIGLWQGTDGSLLPAALDAGNYITMLFRAPGKIQRWLRRLEDNIAAYGVGKDYHYYGVGDIGGAPQEFSIRHAEQELTKGGTIFRQDASESMFLDLTEDEKARLPVYRGDLLLIKHSAGSLTSQAIMKRLNFKNEFLADAAERAAALAQITGAAGYPYARLLAGWERVIASQMHDILPGTCTPEAYSYSYNDEFVALNTFGSVLNDAAEKVIGLLDTAVEGIPLVLYNPLSFDRERIVDAVVPAGDDTALYDPANKRVPLQIIKRIGTRVHVAFPAKAGSMSWEVYSLRPGGGERGITTDLSVIEDQSAVILENSLLRVRIDREGVVDSIYDKECRREMLSSPLHHELLKEQPNSFPAWNMDWKDRKKEPRPLTGPAESVILTEQGPVRATVQITRRFGNSLLVQDISLSCGDAGAMVEFTDSIDWRETGVSLKAAFPLAVGNDTATYNWRVGTVQRGNNRETQYEVPSHIWFDLTDRSGGCGASIITGSKYGSDKPSDNTLRLTLLYTPGRPWHSLLFFDQTTQDWGRHTIRYALYSHRGDWRAARSDLRALDFSQPLYPFLADRAKGPRGRSCSILRCSHDGVVVSAVKCAEEDPGVLIVRLIERCGDSPGAVTLTPAAGIIQAWEVNGQEDRIGDIEHDGTSVRLSFTPHSMRSLAIRVKERGTLSGALASEPVPLPWNEQIVSSNGDTAAPAFTYPRELFPESIVSGNVEFLLQRDAHLNALSCSGQIIPLASAGYMRLHLLAAADEDLEADFEFIGTNPDRAVVTIPARSGFIGQYDTRLWRRPSRRKRRDYFWHIRCTGIEPGYVKRVPLAFFTTHTHRNGADDPYAFGYVFHISLEIPDGSIALRLCRDGRVHILAAALGRHGASASGCLFLHDTYD
ncbi:MAG: alpha-mannosidase [Spirochaetes bacterium]|nr:alpha-mannosidase [Spirochaetota bacterium]